MIVLRRVLKTARFIYLVGLLAFVPLAPINSHNIHAAVPGQPDEYLDLPINSQQGSGALWVSPDGRYVLIGSNTSLIPDGQGQGIFLRDRTSQTTTRMSSQNRATFTFVSMTPDLDTALLVTNASMVPQDSNGTFDVYAKDMSTGTYELISKDDLGNPGNGVSTAEGGPLNISDDGRFVVFKSAATNLGNGSDTNSNYDVFLRDRLLQKTDRLSSDALGNASDGDSGYAQISRDGTTVAFTTDAARVGNVDYPGRKVLVKRLNENLLYLASKPQTGPQQTNPYCLWPTISKDGRFVAFSCSQSQLLASVANAGLSHVYRYDTANSELRIADIDGSGTASDVGSTGLITLSGDGSRVVYSDDQARIFYRDFHDNTGSKLIHQNYSGERLLNENGRILVANILTTPRPALWELPEAPEAAVDQLAPVVSAVPDRSPNENGWYNQPVNIHWDVNDPEPSSGLTGQPADVLASQEGNNTYMSDQVCDNAGNCTSGTIEVALDTAPPVIERHRKHFLAELLRGRLTGWVSDDTSGIAEVSLMDGRRALSSEDGEIKLYCATDRKECRWSIRMHDLRLKRHKLTLVITDYAGNATTKVLSQKD